MLMSEMQTKRPRGRPSTFDYENVLEKALIVFWSRGYEGASMSELTEAMGINRPSMYAAYGNKEQLFSKALAKYMASQVAYVADALGKSTAREVVESFLTKSAEFLTDETKPRGCMIAIGSLFSGEGCDKIKQELISYRQGYERALRERFEIAKAQHELLNNVSPATLAKYIAIVHQGMSVQAASGATKEELLAVVNLSLKNLPFNI